MEPEKIPLTFKFADLSSSTEQPRTAAWASKSRTVLAHPSGRLPTSRHAIGWQPVAGPGSPPEPKAMSVTLRSLHRRVRGEA